MTKTQELELRQAVYDILTVYGNERAPYNYDLAVNDIMAAFAASKQRRASPTCTREQLPSKQGSKSFAGFSLPRKEDLLGI